MSTAIPDAVRPVLDTYLDRLGTLLPGRITGLYLQGSIALGAFQPGRSDIDFIAMIVQPLNSAEVEQLASIHHSIHQQYRHLPLQGSYLQAHHLGKFPGQAEPAPYYYSDGILHVAGDQDLNSVTWWLLKHRGITLLGTPAEELPYSVDWDVLVRHIQTNMDTYWGQYLGRPLRMAALFTNTGVEWVVLGVLRQWYTFEAGAITSKTGAAEYALTRLPAEWHPIIREALRLRRGEAAVYSNLVLRALDAWRFLRFIISHCHRHYRF